MYCNFTPAVGNPVAQTYASYTYTPNGQVATLKDAKNNLTSYQYDGHERKVTTLYPSKTAVNTSSSTDTEQYAFDNNANLISFTKRSGQVINFAYDNLNRLLTRSYTNSSENVNFSYDLLGRRTQVIGATGADTVAYVFDNAGRLTNTTSAGRTLSYQYDGAGNRTRITWPDATPFFVSTSFDALNRPIALQENGSLNLASYQYDDLSRRTLITLGNGTSTGYTYSPQGTLAGLAHDLAGAAQDINYAYTRNQAQEIIQNTWNNDLYQWTGTTKPNATTSYSANGLNHYTAVTGIGQSSAPPSHDANGNLTAASHWTYSYDSDNRLKTAISTDLATPVNASLTYDAQGRLRQTQISVGGVNKQSQLLYDGVDLVAEYDTTTQAIQRRYVHGPGVDEPLVWYEGGGTSAKNWLRTGSVATIWAASSPRPTPAVPAARSTLTGRLESQPKPRPTTTALATPGSSSSKGWG